MDVRHDIVGNGELMHGVPDYGGIGPKHANPLPNGVGEALDTRIPPVREVGHGVPDEPLGRIDQCRPIPRLVRVDVLAGAASAVDHGSPRVGGVDNECIVEETVPEFMEEHAPDSIGGVG